MENCINGAKKLIEEQMFGEGVSHGASFKPYGKTYFWTNENINGYLNLVDLEGKDSALTVLASGDHAFNLIQRGILNIDTFDTNLLTEFYSIELKRAIILKYNYEQYFSFMRILCSTNVSVDVLTDMIKGLFPYMSERSKTFWYEILEYNYKLQKHHGTWINLIRLLCVNTNLHSDGINGYALTEENYNALRSNLSKTNITFKEANAIELDESFDKKYDCIMLSNILDYFDSHFGYGWAYSNLKYYEMRIQKLAKNDALIFLHYIFWGGQNSRLIHDSDIYMSDLNGEEVLEIPNSCDAVLLKRIK